MLLPLSPAFCWMHFYHVISYGVVYLFYFCIDFQGIFPETYIHLKEAIVKDRG